MLAKLIADTFGCTEVTVQEDGREVASMLGSNVKVHFAGSDGSKENFCALVAADTRYRLYSCYNYIVNKKPDDDFRLPEDDIILEQQKQQKHVIQDSGLFT